MTGVITHSTVTGAPADPAALVDGPAFDAAHVITGAFAPPQGGTGVANNAASTITISGSFGLTFTITADTSLTLPTTGTVATLAGSEVLTNKTLTTPVINGLATGTGVASAATASTLASRDASGNTSFNNARDGYTTTATAAGTTVLTVTSTRLQYFTGATTQTITLPDVTTLALGHTFEFFNDSTGTLTINSSGGNLVLSISSSSRAKITCVLLTGTTAASWAFETNFVGVSGGKRPVITNNVTYSGTDGTTITTQATGTVVNRDSTDTLTNKSLSLASNILIGLQGYLSGLALSTAGGSGTFGIATGVTADSTAVDVMTLASAYTKTTSAWAVGTGNGAMDTGAVANSTWYHAYLIKRPDTGVVDVLFSLSASAPTMPTNYTLKRRIGSMKTNGSAQWVLFSQNGDEFLWDVVVNDVNATNPGTSAVTRTLTVPTGVKVNAFVAVTSDSNGINDGRVAITSLDKSDESAAAINAGMYNGISTAEMIVMAYLSVRTNTSAQIRSRNLASAAGSSLLITTHGWTDRRGRDGL